MAIFDVPGAYFNADVPGEKCIVLQIKGEFADIVCEMNPEHKKYTYGKWGKCDIPTSAESIVWIHGVRTTMVRPVYKILKYLGFVINPYDRCIANSVIYGKHFTIAW